MKLNYDCVRKILLFVEENLDYDENEYLSPHKTINNGQLISRNEFSRYNHQEVRYAVEMLIKEGYLECANNINIYEGNINFANIIGLTWKGHELLNNIRNGTVWNAVKTKASKYGGLSLGAMMSAANTLANALLSDSNAVNNFLHGLENIGNLF